MGGNVSLFLLALVSIIGVGVDGFLCGLGNIFADATIVYVDKGRVILLEMMKAMVKDLDIL